MLLLWLLCGEDVGGFEPSFAEDIANHRNEGLYGFYKTLGILQYK
jgi:hypothetical protein